MDKRRQLQKQVLFWLGFLIVVVLGILLLQKILLPFVVGLVLAYALNPLADALERIGVGRTLASLFIVLLLVVVFILALVFLVPILVKQAQQIAAALPADLQDVRPSLKAWVVERFGRGAGEISTLVDAAIDQIAANGAGLASAIARRLWDQGGALVDFVAVLFITPVVMFYMLVDWPAMLKRLDDWLPREHAHTVRDLMSEIDRAVSAFIRGQGLICVVLGTLYTIGLSFIGLPYGILIGIATGVLTFIPVVGTVVGLLTSVVVALVYGNGELVLVAKVLGIFLAGQALDSGFLSPRVVGPKVGLHPVGLIFALFVFSYLFGFVGVLVAVPMAAAVGVLIRFALRLYLSSDIYLSGTDDREDKVATPRSGATIAAPPTSGHVPP